MNSFDGKADQVTDPSDTSGALKQASAPWRPEELKLLGTMPDSKVAQVLNRARTAVRCQRQNLRIRAYQSSLHLWTPDEEQLLGTLPDAEVAARTGHPQGGVILRRKGCTYPCHGPVTSLGQPSKTSCWAPCLMSDWRGG